MFTFRLFNLIRRPVVRNISSQHRLIELTVDQEGIALLSMKRLPVNGLNLELVQDLSRTIDVVQKNQFKGLIITSAAKVFSAGVELNELHKPELTRLRVFVTAVHDFFLKLYAAGDVISAVAINGYSAAGGCIISLICDYRVMVSDSKAKIGLNDTLVGIVPRPWLCDIMSRTMGSRQAEMALTASTMFSAKEALKVNLIDEIASDKADAIEKCKQFIRRYDNIPNSIRAETKRNLRKNTIRHVQRNREEDLNKFIESILNPHAQEQIEILVQQLKSRSNK